MSYFQIFVFLVRDSPSSPSPFSIAVEFDAGGEAVVDSGVDSEVSPSSPDEAEEADDASAAAAAAEATSTEQGTELRSVSRSKSNTTVEYER